MLKDKKMPYNNWDVTFKSSAVKEFALAVKSLEKGTATPGQQKFFLRFVIEYGCRTYDSDWYPDDRDTSSFAAGVRHVGRQLAIFAGMKIGTIKQENRNG